MALRTSKMKGLKRNSTNAHHPLPHAHRVGTKAMPLGTDSSIKASGIEDLVGRAVLKDIAARMADPGLAPHHQDAAARRKSIAGVATTAGSRDAGVDQRHAGVDPTQGVDQTRRASVRHVRAALDTADPAVNIESTIQMNAGMKDVTARSTAVAPRATNSLTDRRVAMGSENREAPGAVKVEREIVVARTGDFGQTSARNFVVSIGMATGCCRVRNFSSFGRRLPGASAQVPGVKAKVHGVNAQVPEMNALLLGDNVAPLKYPC